MQLLPSLIITIASSVMLPLNKLRREDPNKTNIITTAATPNINANFDGEIDSKLTILFLLEKYITIFPVDIVRRTTILVLRSEIFLTIHLIFFAEILVYSK
jgi:hypothetical protein